MARPDSVEIIEDGIPDDNIIVDGELAEDADELAAFEAGYEDDEAPGERRENLLITREPEPEPEPEPETEISSEEEELNALFDEFEDKNNGVVEEEPAEDPAVGKRMRNIEGKFGELNGRIQDLMKQLEAKPAGAGETPKVTEILEALDEGEGGEKFNALSTEFPEFAEGAQELIDLRARQILGKIPDVDALRTEFEGKLEAANNTAATARQLAYLDFKHEGWEDTVKEPVFTKWLAAQPEAVQELQYSPKTKDALALLDGFEAARTETRERNERKAALKDKSKRRLAGAEAPTDSGGSSARRTGGKSADEAFEEGYYE